MQVFADTLLGSVRMLGTSTIEVLQGRDGRMRVHLYTWLMYDMYNHVVLVLEYVINLDLNYFVNLVLQIDLKKVLTMYVWKKLHPFKKVGN